DEMIRLRARIQAAWPDTPIGVYLADFGHQRTGNEQADVDERNEWFLQLFEHYLLDKGPRPGLGFRARAVTCPTRNGSGPLRIAPTWAALHPGEVRHRSAPAQTVSSLGGDPDTVLAFTPLTANDPCKTVAAADAAGTATYRLPPATGDGYTLMGAPTVIASLDVTGVNAQLAARLWDVSPDGRQLLVSRQVLRPRGGGAPEPFQLQPAGWHVAAGHALKLELLGSDAPHYRPSNGVFAIRVRDLDLRLPVAEAPGAGPVTAPAAPLMPAGARPAVDLPPPRRLAARVTYPSCRVARVTVTGPAIEAVSVQGARRDTRRPFAVRVRRRKATLHVRVRRTGETTKTLRVRMRVC
ncbi:MAG TPA: CocE/NonD family hydrolase C-terminal non-catalytic domain-containing protein, partial [Solirubrobacteraceae bacterium]